jgi:O-antigen/teichoic acid export membrane protein
VITGTSATPPDPQAILAAGDADHGFAAARQATRGFVALGAGELAARLAAFGAAVYVSRTLGAGDFGVIGFATAVMLYLQRIVLWELEATGISEVANDDERARRVISSLLGFRLIVAVVLMIVTGLVAYEVLPHPDRAVLATYTVALFATALNVRWVYLMRRDPTRPAVARILAEGVGALVVLLLVRSPADTLLVPLGLICGETVGAGVLLAPLARRAGVRPRIEWSIASPLARRAAPLLVSGILSLIVFNFDLVMLRLTRGADEAGYYAAAYAVVALLVNLGMAYYANVLPAFVRLRAESRQTQALYDGASTLVWLATLPVAAGGVLVAAAIVHTLFGAGYEPSGPALAVLMVSAGLNIVRFVPLAALVGAGRSGRVLALSLVGAVVNVALNLMLIPRYGMLGAAASTVATDVVRLALNLAFVSELGLRAISLRSLWRPVLAATCMAVVVWLRRDGPIWISVPAGATAYAVGVLALGAVRLSPAGRPELRV